MKLLAYSAAMVVGLAAINPAQANDGTIEITGAITDTTCTIEGQPPGGGNVTKTVPLGDVSATHLATAGSTASDLGFTIKIGGSGETGCTDGDTAKVRFDPSSPLIDLAVGRLNVDNGGATNVQVQILNANGTPIMLGTEDSAGVVIDDNQAIIPMIARYYATGAATAGAATSRVGFEVVYE